MRPIPQSPEDFHWKSGKGTFEDALGFLVDLKRFVADLKIPDGKTYRQIPHSGDPKPVGGDVRRPAVLDASYPFAMTNDHILSVSTPIFLPSIPQKDVINIYDRELTSKEKLLQAFGRGADIKTTVVDIDTGLHAFSIQESFIKLLEGYGITDCESTKIGYCLPEQTNYIETRVSESDFEKGRKIIQAYVHGDAQTAEELKAEIDKALGPSKLSLEQQSDTSISWVSRKLANIFGGKVKEPTVVDQLSSEYDSKRNMALGRNYSNIMYQAGKFATSAKDVARTPRPELKDFENIPAFLRASEARTYDVSSNTDAHTQILMHLGQSVAAADRMTEILGELEAIGGSSGDQALAEQATELHGRLKARDFGDDRPVQAKGFEGVQRVNWNFRSVTDAIQHAKDVVTNLREGNFDVSIAPPSIAVTRVTATKLDRANV